MSHRARGGPATPPAKRPGGYATLTRMKRRVRWTTLVPWLVLVWCAEVVVSHYSMPYTWERALGGGLFQIPVLMGLGIFTLRRAKRRAHDQLPVEQAHR